MIQTARTFFFLLDCKWICYWHSVRKHDTREGWLSIALNVGRFSKEPRFTITTLRVSLFFMRDLKRRKDINERTKIVSGCFLTSLLESTKRGGLKPRANFPVRCQSNNPVTCIFLVIGWWGCAAGWGYILIIMELRFNRAIRMRLHIFGIKKLWYKGI